MIRNIYIISMGHLNVAKEHCIKYGIKHEPTFIQALILTIKDFIFNYTIVDKETKSYLVYEKNYMNTLGLESALIIRSYVPIDHRGNGILKKMINKIPQNIIMEIRDEQIRNKNGKKLVGTIYSISKDI